MSEIHIFNPNGAVDRVFLATDQDVPIFFTLVAKQKTGEPFGTTTTGNVNKGSILYGGMPVAGLAVDQGVDHTVAKTLGDDFLVSEFGNTPVQISLNGVNFFGPVCDNTDDWGKQNQQALDFYEKYKLSSNPDIRLALSITEGRTQAGQFTCVLTKMRVVGPAVEKSGTIPLYTYNLTLIGVRSKKA